MKPYKTPELIEYKHIEAEQVAPDIIRVDLFRNEDTRDRTYHVQVLFAYNKVFYTGDVGSYIFGKDICHNTTFFCGSDINPGYWQGKCEAYSEPLEEEEVNVDDLIDAVEKYLKDHKIEDYEDNFDTFKMSFSRYDVGSVTDHVEELFADFDIDDTYLEASDLVSSLVEYNIRYLYACTVLQYVSNHLEEWLKGGKNDKE